jgi:hypothetical protein
MHHNKSVSMAWINFGIALVVFLDAALLLLFLKP